MKNEDKIVELLSESLKRQDQMVERLGNLEKGFVNLEQRQKTDSDRVITALNGLTDIVKVWSCPIGMDKTREIDDLRDRINRLEKHTGI